MNPMKKRWLDAAGVAMPVLRTLRELIVLALVTGLLAASVLNDGDAEWRDDKVALCSTSKGGLCDGFDENATLRARTQAGHAPGLVEEAAGASGATPSETAYKYPLLGSMTVTATRPHTLLAKTKAVAPKEDF